MQENQRVRLTKTLLKNSLTELAETTPLEKISVKSLCSRAGINRSTFYTHYGSPYDVLHDMEDDFVWREYEHTGSLWNPHPVSGDYPGRRMRILHEK
ncbi:MAG: TetR/AcrR family transcriptional regulator [Eubacterium sp.]